MEDRARQAADRAAATLVGDPAEQLGRTAAADEQDEILRSARRLQDRLAEAGDRAAALVRAAGEALPYHRPGLLGGATAAVDGWIDDNADALRTASAALKAVSAVAALLAFVPVLVLSVPPRGGDSAGRSWCGRHSPPRDREAGGRSRSRH